eukprot:TRINITY_DN30274_c0_g1_i1.p1 TRINITY_DN30274_c0_g1~~TRINITY_DN30274_c0_g1_i1.p1  ORF type:complete len:315 (+),score=79.21 TRINITY_DN30274_c0_g1_i1:69-1013(+)
MSFTPFEEGPRLRRKSTFRMWTREEEDELLLIEAECGPVETCGSKESQLARKWVERGYEGYAGEELLKKLESVHRIKEMLKKSDSFTERERKNSRSTSLLEDQRWEEETLQLVKVGDYEAFAKRLSGERRASQVSDVRDRTALHHAAATGNLNMVKLIYETTPEELEAVDKDGRTPLFFCLEGAHDEIVDWMLEKGVAVGVSDIKGITPLHVAAHTNNRHCIKALLAENACKVNSADEKGATALHVAAHRACSEVIECLLKAGADPSIKDKRGNLAEHLAERMEKRSNHRRLSSLSSTASAISAAVKFKKVLTE